MNILHVEDNLLDAELVKQRLEDEKIPCVIDRVGSRASFETSLRLGSYDIIISDFSLPGFPSDVPMSLADACLVRMTETLADPIILTTDEDFRVYRRHSRQVVPCVTPE